MGNYIKPDTSRYSMMWYKYLVYFGLFASAIVNLGQGVMIIKGDIYSTSDITADMIYDMFGHTLKTIDCIYGVCAMIMAVVAVVFWFMLIHYRKKALKYVSVFYGGMLGI